MKTAFQQSLFVAPIMSVYSVWLWASFVTSIPGHSSSAHPIPYTFITITNFIIYFFFVKIVNNKFIVGVKSYFLLSPLFIYFLLRSLGDILWRQWRVLPSIFLSTRRAARGSSRPVCHQFLLCLSVYPFGSVPSGTSQSTQLSHRLTGGGSVLLLHRIILSVVCRGLFVHNRQHGPSDVFGNDHIGAARDCLTKTDQLCLSLVSSDSQPMISSIPPPPT